MSDNDTAAKLARLRRLLADYSYAERRRAGMLFEIDALLQWALAGVVQPGAGPADVEAALGPPYGVVGDGAAGEFQWLYPCAGSPAELERAPQWFYALRFENGGLQSIERRGWTD